MPKGSLLYATRALRQLRLSGPISNEREADALQNLAASYHVTGRHREAFEHYTEGNRQRAGRSRDEDAGTPRNLHIFAKREQRHEHGDREEGDGREVPERGEDGDDEGRAADQTCHEERLSTGAGLMPP